MFDSDFKGHPTTLGALFRDAGLELPANTDPDLELNGLTENSRTVVPGAAFVAVRGETVDGHRFIQAAIEKGAAAIICQQPPIDPGKAHVILLKDTREALPRLAHAWYGNPSRDLTVVGITGTNGKTTTAYLAESLLQGVGRRPALFSTVEYRFGDQVHPAPTTTPGAFQLAQLMCEFRAQGADAIVMEVSSHSLIQGRVAGIHFDVALMTNLTQDHLDYHSSMEEYAEAKRLFFTRYRPGCSIFNLDDPTAARFSGEHEGPQLTYSTDANSEADLKALALEMDAHGIQMTVGFPKGKAQLRSPLRGGFNASNMLAACAIGTALGVEPDRIVASVQKMEGAPGRFELVGDGRPFAVFVDYAHTPDAVERVLENVRAITPEKVICVLGCGGDRDPGKRPKMGAAMGRLADYSIITNDNPRSEDPARIAAAMEEAIRLIAPGRYEVCLDRGKAIRRAIERARSGDSVVIAGKGHETYQIIGSERSHFDDREEAETAIGELAQGS